MEERAKQRAEKKALLEEKRRRDEEYKLVSISTDLPCYNKIIYEYFNWINTSTT